MAGVQKVLQGGGLTSRIQTQRPDRTGCLREPGRFEESPHGPYFLPMLTSPLNVRTVSSALPSP